MKPKVIILYGPMAVGKLTAGRRLSELVGISLVHNHLINDLVFSLFTPRTVEGNTILEKTRYDFYTKAVQSGKSFILTHAYSHNYVSPTGQTDPEYLKNLETRLGNAGAEVYFVHLQASNEQLLQRLIMPSRKEYKKLVEVEIMKEYLKTKDFKTSADVPNQLILDTSELGVDEVVEEIRSFVNV